MPKVLTDTPSIIGRFMAELRDVQIQTDSMRFRKNLERIGELLAYEISKELTYETIEVETPLGISPCQVPVSEPVLATVLRAGLPMHAGMLNVFDKADNAFISAYRRHHKDGTFEIQMEYVSCPSIEGRVLILIDPMLATGASVEAALKELYKWGKPAEVHIAAAIGSREGVLYVKRKFPKAKLWLAAIDEELTARSYIVPGLGDAGDLAYGSKSQD